LHVYRLSEPIDDFDGLTPLNEWLDGDAERLAWALQAVLALAEAAPTVGWKGDMRHLPLVGHLPTSPFVTRYLVVKQDNNGDTFLICQADPAELLDHAAADEVTPGPVGAWLPPNASDLRLDEPEPGIELTGIDPGPWGLGGRELACGTAHFRRPASERPAYRPR
jgi:hypothetical protein